MRGACWSAQVIGGRVAVAVLLSLVFPGAGQGLAARRVRMVAFAIADLAVTVGILVSVWALVASLLVRLVAAVDAFAVARRQAGGEGSWGLAGIAVVIGIIGVAFTSVAVEGFRIPSDSMVPTFAADDRVYVDRLSPRWKKLERGEVVVFNYPCGKVAYVKRVMGLGGDTVEVRCGVVYVNGTALPHDSIGGDHYRESLDGHAYIVDGAGDNHDFPDPVAMIAPRCTQGNFYDQGDRGQPAGKLVETKPRGTASTCEVQAHFVVPAHSLFVMGDNRGHSNDSRFWGVVPESALIGRVIGVYAPWARFGGIR